MRLPWEWVLFAMRTCAQLFGVLCDLSDAGHSVCGKCRTDGLCIMVREGMVSLSNRLRS